jgi:hypothetical protein
MHGIKNALTFVFLGLALVIEVTSTLAQSNLEIRTFEGHSGGAIALTAAHDARGRDVRSVPRRPVMRLKGS